VSNSLHSNDSGNRNKPPRGSFHPYTKISASIAAGVTVFGIVIFLLRAANYISDAAVFIDMALAFATFIGSELAISISASHRLERSIEEDAKLIKTALEESAEIIRSLAEQRSSLLIVMDSLAKIFASEKHPHTAVQHAVKDLLGSVKMLANGQFAIENGILSKLTYMHFWKILLALQTERHFQEKGDDIHVYVTHMASTALWGKNDQYRDIRKIQKDFIELGGKIDRIFIHKSVNEDEPENYAKTMIMLRDEYHIDSLFVDVKGSHLDGDAQDFLLAHLGDNYYSFVAHVDWVEGEGDIVSSNIELGRVFYDSHRGHWRELLELMRKRQLPTQIEAGLEVLWRQPSRKMLEDAGITADESYTA
jgi:hypothetical protein